MFASCMLRSGTIPTMLRSDRGPELKNALMNEYTALLGIGRRFGTPWEPMEQGLVEGKHVEQIVDVKGLECPTKPKTPITDSRVQTAAQNTKSSI